MTAFYNRIKHKDFVIKLLVFLLTITVADLILGKLLQKTYWRQRQGYDYLTTYSIEKTRAQVLVFGSSRAVNIFDPSILQDELGATCFNAGRVGQSVFYHYAVLKAVLKRYTPQAVILSLDAGDFAKDPKDYERISQLLPYYEQHPEIRDVVNLKGPFERIKILSSVYPYNSLILPIVKGNLTSNTAEHSTDGFIPLKKKIKGPLHKMDFEAFANLDQNKVDAYRSFISECRNRGTQLYIVCPPYRINAAGEDKSLVLAKQLAKENNIEFFDYSADTDYTSREEYFADFKHLNHIGSALFSKQVALKIKGPDMSVTGL